ncbi:hypothetical protein SmJEL517_g03948 [Synchytrium microbalum]|uniref:Major facilitator superfamily (MFS) profile domain-containing protein n=1 Tax=Synchytrium microbalum TaxID=1806994 RepID=A0A507C220_9FUNG|nr:uncharacterized protein SmJEL517_g03948 [Synchytrium microbalum]TPX33099.1 hypothetical protein SmJEL517_g03948 [Synchytrium microbalum]
MAALNGMNSTTPDPVPMTSIKSNSMDPSKLIIEEGPPLNIESLQIVDSGEPPPKYEKDVDRGYALVVAFAGFLLHFCSWGFIFSWGVFQRQYASVNFASSSSLSFVGTTNITMALIAGAPIGQLAAIIGHRRTILLGCVVYTLGLFLASFATQLWHLILSVGVLCGLGCSLCFVPALSLVPQWFKKWRALATGFVAAGSGIGGFSWSLINARLIDALGPSWTFRIASFICAGIFAFAVLILRVRNPPGRVKIDFKLLLDPSMMVINIGGFFLAFGYFPPIFFMSQYAGSFGLDPSSAALITGLFNIGSAIGRVVNGLGADYVGCFNALATTVTLSAVAILAVMPNATAFGSLLGFSMFYGFASGGFQSLFPVVIVQKFGAVRASFLIGVVYTPWIFGQLLSSFIFGTIVEAHGGTTLTSAYLPGILFAGGAMAVAAAFMITLRIMQSRQLLKPI